MPKAFQNRLLTALLYWSLAGLVGGLILKLFQQEQIADLIWMAGVIPVLVALIVEIISSLRQGNIGLDIVAALSMTAALIFGETLAASVVALMYSGGSFLEGYAEGRARKDMTALLSRVPRTAMRYEDGALHEVPLETITPGDRLMIRQGDIVPVDGTLISETAMIDASALTGEALPIRHMAGQAVMSGATNSGPAFDLETQRAASESTYAGILRLVENAQKSRAPMARMADRYALLFLALTLLIAGSAWFLTGDPIRAVAVLVIATPCPLILAVPVALVAGLSRAAHFGVLVKAAKALEDMSRVRVMILDKTGTLTDGRPKVLAISPEMGLPEAELLRLAASLDQASKHPMSQALVAHALERGLTLTLPNAVAETAGEGIVGDVAGQRIIVGGAGFVADKLGRTVAIPEAHPGAAIVAIAVEGQFAGTITLSDQLRDGTTDFLAGLRQQGIERILLATGDRHEVAQTITEGLDLDGVFADLSPARKVALLQAEKDYGPVMMVGDGVNDAPSLAAADVGVAMGARGAAASAETADVVLLVDRIDRLLPGLRIARGARKIALQCIIAGIGLSLLGMIAAALGYLSPVEGALLQEVIDVAAILNALRVLAIKAEA